MGNGREEITYEVVETIGVLSVNSNSGWKKELNRVSWNNGRPKFDIREWDPEHERMGRGLTFSEDEARTLCGMLNEYFG